MKQMTRTRKTHLPSDKNRFAFNYKLVIEYEGTRFQGWQIQPGVKTVQGIILAAVQSLFPDDKIELYGAGRTDKGVHALAQVAHLKLSHDIRPDVLRFKINDILPHDITIKTCHRAGVAFHARHDATARTYLYQIAMRKSALAKNFVWWIKDTLDIGQMAEACLLLNGTHDFSSFCDKRFEKDSTVVKVFEVRIELQNDVLLIRITADHFLWKMVRKIVAFLVEIGRTNLSAQHLASVLEKQKPFPDIPTAPPSGLFLEKIHYREPKPEDTALTAVTPMS